MSLKIREFRDEDMPGVCKAFVEGFASRIKTVRRLNRYDPDVIEGLVGLFIESGDLSIVAESDGKARGILVGEFTGDLLSVDTQLFMTRFISTLLKISDHRTISSLLDGFMYVLQFSKYYGSVPSVLLLTSQKDFRGGIGTKLMDRWIEEIEKEGYDSTIVGTDERLAWRFYEGYGFERDTVFELRPRLFSEPSEKIDGYIYRYDV